MAETAIVLEVTLDTGPVRVEVDPNADLEPLTPDEFVMLMGFIKGTDPQTDEDTELAAAGGAIVVHLHRALPDLDPIDLARAVRGLL